MSDSARELSYKEAIAIKNSKKLYIYAQVDIDKAYSQIILKSKKIRSFLQSNSLDFDFQEKIRNYKNFRICFDNQIQKYIQMKQLAADLRIIKKNVQTGLEDFIIERYKIYLEDQQLHNQYKAKVEEVQAKFAKRMEELMRGIQE